MDKLALTALMLAAAACQVRPPRETPSSAPTLEDVAAQARRDPWATPTEPFGLQSVAETASAPPSSYGSTPLTTIVGKASAEAIALPTARDVIAAMHGARLSVLTLTDDGRSAVSADVAGSVRLWRSLDGTREPIIVRTHPPSLLALARDGEDFLIAAVDHAGQLELVRTQDTGRAVARTAIDTQRALLAVYAVRGQFIALRDDHALVTIDFDGSLHGPLAAEPGEHVASLAVRHGRMLAVVGTSEATQGRWISIDDGGTPRWGERTPALPFAADTAVLSPSGNRVAGISKNRKSIIVVELPSGRVLARNANQGFVDPKLSPVGFLRDDLLASSIGTPGRMAWWGRVLEAEDFVASGPVAVADGRIASDANGALILDDGSDDPYYLGYRVGTPTDVLPYEGGFLATDGRAIAVLDDAFHTRKAYDMPSDDASQTWYATHLIDRTHVAAYSYTRQGSGLYSVDLATNTATLVSLGGLIDYQPATHLAAIQSGTALHVARFDSKAGTFGELIQLPVEVNENPRIQLLDPARARGHVMAIVTNKTNDRVRIRLVKSVVEHPAEGAESLEITRDKTFTVGDDFWETSGDTLTLVDRLLPTSPRLASPDRKHSVEIAGPRVILRDAAGQPVWTVPSSGAIAARWTPDGRLVAYGAGISELDVATGAVTHRQCGARFGLWHDAPLSSGIPTQCEAPEHF